MITVVVTDRHGTTEPLTVGQAVTGRGWNEVWIHGTMPENPREREAVEEWLLHAVMVKRMPGCRLHYGPPPAQPGLMTVTVTDPDGTVRSYEDRYASIVDGCELWVVQGDGDIVAAYEEGHWARVEVIA